MNNKAVCNELSQNVLNVQNALKNYLLRALKDAEQQLIELMRQEIMNTVHGGGPGKPDWRNEISESLDEVFEEVTDNYIKVGVGVPAPSSRKLATLVKAMIIESGAGSAVGREPIKTKPGQLVWDNDMNRRHRSKAKSVYQLPAAFNQQGNQFIENAIKRMEKHLNDILDSAAENIPDSVFYGNVTVKKR